MARIDLLKVELSEDPLARGYAAMSDAAAAESLNTENRSRDRDTLTGQELFEAVLPSEYNALSDDHKMLLLGIIGMGEILVSGPNTRAVLMAMFGPPTITRANLVALQTEPISRAEERGLGIVKVGYVQRARA